MLIDHLDRALEEQANAHVAQIDRLSERVASVETKLEEHVMVMERFGRAVERNVRWIHPGRTDMYCYGEFERALYADVLQLVDESWMERRRPRYWDFLQEARVKRGREVAGLGVEEEGEAEEDERGGNEELVRSPGGVEENREPIGDRDGEAIQLQDKVERILGLIPDSELGPLPGEAEGDHEHVEDDEPFHLPSEVEEDQQEREELDLSKFVDFSPDEELSEDV